MNIMLVLRKETFGHYKVDPMGEKGTWLGYTKCSFTDGTSQTLMLGADKKILRNMGRENFDNKIRAIYLILIWPCFLVCFCKYISR